MKKVLMPNDALMIKRKVSSLKIPGNLTNDDISLILKY